MKKGVSIIICTYNGRDRLGKTLSYLVKQKKECPTEIVLVDNNSNDDSKSFADDWWLKHGSSDIQYASYVQPIPGKSYAQELAYNHAQYEYLLICDDDNWLCETYVQTAFDIMENDSQIGGLGGWCEAVFEKDKPKWFDTYARYFAVSKQGTESGDITNKKGCLYGAGMVIRKSHWLELNKLGFKPLLTCRKGETLSSGGDTEYSYVLRLLGYKIWYDDRLFFQHWMPEGRMSLDYVSRIRQAMSESNFVVNVYRDEWRNCTVSRKVFYQKAYYDIKNKLPKHVVKRIFGNFEERELSKEFFRKLNRLLTRYNDYNENRAAIKKWLPSK